MSQGVSTKIAEARKAAGLSQEELSARIGIDRTSLARYETGKTSINIEVLEKISVVLGKSPGWFFDAKNPQDTNRAHEGNAEPVGALRIRIAREELGISQEQMAKRLDMSANAVRKWESGHGSPYPKTLQKISQITGKSVAWLRGEESDAQPPPVTTQSPPPQTGRGLGEGELFAMLSRQQAMMERQQEDTRQALSLLAAQQASSDRVVDSLTRALDRVGSERDFQDKQTAKQVASLIATVNELRAELTTLKSREKEKRRQLS